MFCWSKTRKFFLPNHALIFEFNPSNTSPSTIKAAIGIENDSYCRLLDACVEKALGVCKNFERRVAALNSISITMFENEESFAQPHKASRSKKSNAVCYFNNSILKSAFFLRLKGVSDVYRWVAKIFPSALECCIGYKARRIILKCSLWLKSPCSFSNMVLSVRRTSAPLQMTILARCGYYSTKAFRRLPELRIISLLHWKWRQWSIEKCWKSKSSPEMDWLNSTAVNFSTIKNFTNLLTTNNLFHSIFCSLMVLGISLGSGLEANCRASAGGAEGGIHGNGKGSGHGESAADGENGPGRNGPENKNDHWCIRYTRCYGGSLFLLDLTKG